MKSDLAWLSAGPASGSQGTVAAMIGPTGRVTKYDVLNELS